MMLSASAIVRANVKACLLVGGFDLEHGPTPPLPEARLSPQRAPVWGASSHRHQ